LIVEIVGDAADQRAENLHFLSVAELRFELTGLAPNAFERLPDCSKAAACYHKDRQESGQLRGHDRPPPRGWHVQAGRR
jgi:hypothetical protein